MLSDDVGYGDTELAAADPRGHAADLPHTPQLAALARAPGSLVLDNFYVQPLCSASRAALLTGRHPIHTGMQTHVLQPQQRRGLPLEEVTVAERLKELGYSTHLVGKWHQGYSRWAYTPRWRGFDSFFGMYTGASDHYNHRMSTTNNTVPEGGPVRGPIDLRRNEAPVSHTDAAPTRGVHSSDLYADEAVAIIEEHRTARLRVPADAVSAAPPPLFLMLAFQAAHDPIQTPPGWAERNAHIRDPHRRQFAGLVSHLDAAIGRVVGGARALGWSSTLVLYLSDNGGVPYLGSSNYPWRGAKGGLWEGGARTQLLVGGGALVPQPVALPLVATTADGGYARRLSILAHVTDIFPTLLAAAREAPASSSSTSSSSSSSSSSPAPRPANGPLDGYNLWPSLRAAAASGAPVSGQDQRQGPRRDVLLNIDDVGYPLLGSSGLNMLGLQKRLRRTLARTLGWADRSGALRSGRHKLIVGIPGAPHRASSLHNTSRAAVEMAASMAGSERLAAWDARLGWPAAVQLERSFPRLAPSFQGWEAPMWLFDVEADPHESVNLLVEGSAADVAVAERLLTRLAQYKAGAVSPPVNAHGTFSHGWREHVGFFPPRHGGFIAPFDEPGVPLHGAWLAYGTFGTLLALALLLLPLLPLVGVVGCARALRRAALPTMRAR
jgi:arylsulfatase A-like enzyme